MQEKSDAKGNRVNIFNEQGLKDASTAVEHCDKIFGEVRGELNKASKGLGEGPHRNAKGPLRLTPAERAKWPFLQPRMNGLRTDLREAKDTLLLMLTVATLAHAEKLALGQDIKNHAISSY